MGERVSLKGLGWMTFTVAATNVLHLGGASKTAPTDHLSADALLAAGIPSNEAGTGFADGIGDLCADIYLVSGTWRTADDGSEPTATEGNVSTDPITYRLSPEALWNFKAYILTNAVVEVVVYRGVVR